jgi:hypothetical protein
MTYKKSGPKIVLAISTLIIILTAMTASAVLNSNQTILTSGKIVTVNVGVYKDSGCTQTATTMDWGTLNAGDNKTISLWIKNTGASKITLSLTSNNWTPTTASPGLSLSWNQEKKTLTTQQTVQATLTLKVSPSINGSISNFSFNIIITGTA